MRSFGWHDLITIYRYRNQYLSLDSALDLTRGNPFSPLGVLAHLNPSRESFTGVSSSIDNSQALFGQVYHTIGAKYAHLSFLLPGDSCYSQMLTPLIEGLAREAGSWGVFHLLAEVNEHEIAFPALRKAGFSVYGWQRIWNISHHEETESTWSEHWRPATDQDMIAVRNLYHSLVPPLVQRAEPHPTYQSHGLVYYQDGDLLGFLESIVGPLGIYLQPLLHPATENMPELIKTLPSYFLPRLGRPIYLVVRSYQAWMEASLEELKADVAPRQALLVRYLTIAQRNWLIKTRFTPVLESPQPETTVTAVNHFICDN